MRCHLWHFGFVYFIIFLTDMLEILFPVQGDHWHIIFVQIQKTDFPVYHRFCLWLFAVLNDFAETLFHLVCHGYKPCTALGFRLLYDILHIPFPLQLMIDVDNTVFQVNIRNRQPYKFRNPKSCLKKDWDIL